MGRMAPMAYGSGTTETNQVKFGGYRHTEDCGDGEFYDMYGLTSKDYPVLGVREEKRYIQELEAEGNAFTTYRGAILTVRMDDTWTEDKIYINALEIGSLPKRESHDIIQMGDRCLIMPELIAVHMRYYILQELDTEADLQTVQDPAENDAYLIKNTKEIWVWLDGAWTDTGPVTENLNAEAEFTATAENGMVKIKDGTLYGLEAKANTLSIGDSLTGFKKGDGVRLEGLTVIPENNRFYVIREIAEEGGRTLLRFDEDAFDMPENGDGTFAAEYTETGTIRISRTVPDMEFAFWCGNRLWGAKGGEIFASKLGDPTNFNVFDGLSTDSWYIDTQRPDYTAGIGRNGTPVFFREMGMTTIYGSKPSVFQATDTAVPGVRHGEWKSLAEVRGMLFYLSSDGFRVLMGDQSQSLNSVFGNIKYREAVAGSDGKLLYLGCLSEEPAEERRNLFVWDTDKNIWMRRDTGINVRAFSWDGDMFALWDRYIISISGGTGNLRYFNPRPNHELIWSMAETGDQVEDTTGHKALHKLLLRMEVEENASVIVRVKYDHGDWENAGSLAPGKKRTEILAFIPHRCDHYRIRIEGQGEWKLYALTKVFRRGTALH